MKPTLVHSITPQAHMPQWLNFKEDVPFRIFEPKLLIQPPANCAKLLPYYRIGNINNVLVKINQKKKNSIFKDLHFDAFFATTKLEAQPQRRPTLQL